MNNVALYIRVSTPEQAQEGYSIGEQKERLISYCKARAWIVSDIYIDGGYSGSNLNRPAIQKMISETDKYDTVLVYKLDRLSRSQRDTLYLIEEVFNPKNIAFVSMQESFDTSSPFGKATIGLLAVFAQLEREQIKERTRMGFMARIKAGYYRGGGFAPLGYKYDKGLGKLVVDPYGAELVRLMYKMYAQGASAQKIQDHFIEQGFYKNPSSSYTSSILHILSNVVYLGHTLYNGICVENTHDAIITQEQFDLVQFLRQRWAKRAASENDQYLLTGLIYCGKCSARFHSISREQRRYCYYGCYSRTKRSRYMAKAPKCDNKIWHMDALDAEVEKRVKELLVSPQMIRELAKTKHAEPVKPLGVEKRISELDKQIEKLMSLYQTDAIPVDVLSTSINKLYAEKTAIQRTLPQEEEPVNLSVVEALLADARQVWDFADTQQKRRILSGLIKRITITDKQIDIEWAFQ